ncbi:MAG: Uma2 family endonuclease [Stackebrandtia sp.]
MAAPAYEEAPAVPPSDDSPKTVDLLDAFDQLTVPLGFRAELIDGEIVVTPPADGNHERSISRISKQIDFHDSQDLDISGNKGLITPAGRCIPDLTVGTAEAFIGQEAWSLPDGVRLVVEVTSANAGRDRVIKRHRYAAADIGLYLLVDRQERAVTLFSDPDPAGEDYRGVHRVPYGEKLSLPEPFGFELDTSELP